MRIVLAIFVLTCTITACTQDKFKSYVNKDLKSYFGYQAGTYWIFYDSLNTHYDSLVVTGFYDVLPYTQGSNSAEDAGFYGTLCNTDSVADSMHWGVEMGNVGSSVILQHWSLRVANSLTSGMPFETGTINIPSLGYTRITTLLPVYSVNGTSYSNVYEITLSNSTRSYQDTYYINHDNGFIKVILNNQNFHKRLYLVRQHINR